MDAESSAGIQIQLQPNGKVLVYGANSEIFFAVQKDIIRLNADGSLDAGFVAASPLDYQGVGIVTVQANGRLLLDTRFDRYGGAAAGSYHLTRLLKSGRKDASFQSAYFRNPSLSYPFGARLSAVTVLPDGNILVAGDFTQINTVTQPSLARLNADGSVDSTFVPDFGSQPVTNALRRQDRSIVVSGTFVSVNNQPRPGFAALHADGTLDPSFVPDAIMSGANGDLVAVQTDRKVLVTQQQSSSPLQLLRLNGDGSLYESFTPVTVTKGNIPESGESLALAAVQVEADGKILVVGNFTTINGMAHNGVVQLRANGGIASGAK